MLSPARSSTESILNNPKEKEKEHFPFTNLNLDDCVTLEEVINYLIETGKRVVHCDVCLTVPKHGTIDEASIVTFGECLTCLTTLDEREV